MKSSQDDGVTDSHRSLQGTFPNALAQSRLSPAGNALDLAAWADVEHALQGAISLLYLARPAMAYQR